MVGHLQANKVKYAVKLFDLIQSVDSLRLAEEINKESAKINKIQDILLEVKTSPEATKFGLMSEGAVEVIKEISRLKNIRIQGLMTIAPIVDNPQLARPYFRMLRDLRDKICQLPFANYHLPILSMGMTDDFEVAIEEGATMVRIGRAIFG
jgi:pyridoxal phosphate enzyme (YggS family)